MYGDTGEIAVRAPSLPERDPILNSVLRVCSFAPHALAPETLPARPASG